MNHSSEFDSSLSPTLPSTTHEVSEWLSSIGYSQYRETFESNQITGQILHTLTSIELRDDLHITNLSHRRSILKEISELSSRSNTKQNLQTSHADSLPEHGRILDHLSNVRTYHSWIRVGVQLLGLVIAVLRLTPIHRRKPVSVGLGLGICIVVLCVFGYAVYRYRTVVVMIERSKVKERWYRPDMIGIWGLFTLVLAVALSILGVVLMNGF